jgi:hypothetical protein
MEGVEKLTAEKALSMKESCINRARDFSLEGFTNQMQNYFSYKDDTVFTDESTLNGNKKKVLDEYDDEEDL